MRIENALRWQRLWWFISLNFLRELAPDLWLHMPIKALQEHVQSRIDSERDLPTFGSDPRLKAYRMLTSVKETFGGEALEYLCTWQKCVFVQGGDDRVEEFVWGMLASELLERANELKLRAEFHSALQSFHSISEKRLSKFRKDLSDASAASLSVWDQNAIAAEGESLDTVLNLITNICSSNIFALTWHETCTSRGPAFLEGIFEVALKTALEDTSGRLIFSVDTLPFPSSWEFDLEKGLNRVVAVSH
jgi:hypothetical protein